MANKRNILVCGGGEFIVGHLAKDLKEQGHNVRVVDKKPLDSGIKQLKEQSNLFLTLNCVKTA